MSMYQPIDYDFELTGVHMPSWLKLRIGRRVYCTVLEVYCAGGVVCA